MTSRAASWIVIALGVAVLLVPVDPALIERWYSTRVYLTWQPSITRAANAFPFALFDAVLVGVALAVLAILIAALRGFRPGQRLRAAATAFTRVLTLGAVLYLWFVAMWGLNYRREPLLARLELARPAPATDTVIALGRRAVEQMNALHAAAHAQGFSDPWSDRTMRQAYQHAQIALADAPLAAPGRLKGSLIGPYFRWASVDGMIDPFALEVLSNPDLLDFERPFVAAHEWAHLAGYATESEASFVGFVTCLGADRPAQYSAWLFLYWEITGSLSRADRAVVDVPLTSGPRADIAGVVERVRRGQLPRLRTISWAAYDQYLKANRVEEGVRSYDEVITLLTRARFKDGWVPVRAIRTPSGR